jgi:hypothetical protein
MVIFLFYAYFIVTLFLLLPYYCIVETPRKDGVEVVIHAPFYDDPKPPGGEEGTTIEIEQFCLMKLFKMVTHYNFF